MVRQKHPYCRFAGCQRQGSSTLPAVAAVGGFAVIVGILLMTVSRDTSQYPAKNSQSTEQAVAGAARSEETARHNAVDTPAVPGASDEADTPQAGLQHAGIDTDVSHRAIDAESAEALMEKVAAQLAAGEFGPAIDTAAASHDPKKRATLFRMIADAQMQIGDFEAARGVIRRIPLADARADANRERTQRESLSGGGVNFEELIDIIQSNTGRPANWSEGEDVDFAEEGAGTIKTWGASQDKAGVLVDPNGMLSFLSREDRTRRLSALGVRARVADLNQDMARASSMRLVSLTRLEKEVAQRLDQGERVLATMKHLAGLSQVRYLFIYPDEGEIVIGGPAEGWHFNELGEPVGVASGRPTLQLDDLVTVLRTFSDGGNSVFSCSIVPRSSGLKATREYADRSAARGPLPAGGGVKNFVNELQKRLGEQDVVLEGIPEHSRVARAIVEADYRMKLIGIGKLSGGPDIPSYFDLLPAKLPQATSDPTALRWWLTMKYDSVMHSANRDAFQIQGSSVRCLSENELINAQGQRQHTGKAEATNRQFAANFTAHYDQLASREPVFADVKNIFDLALVAALINHNEMDDRVGWNRGVFAINGAYQPTLFEPARTVMSVVNHRVYSGREIVIQVAGGVTANLMSVVTDKTIVRQVDRVGNLLKRARPQQLPDGRWWWDATE